MKPYQKEIVDLISDPDMARLIPMLPRRSGKSTLMGSTFGMWTDGFISDFDRRYNWCLENLGPATDYPPRWQPGELGHPLRFRFRDSEDEFLFKLKWGTLC